MQIDGLFLPNWNWNCRQTRDPARNEQERHKWRNVFLMCRVPGSGYLSGQQVSEGPLTYFSHYGINSDVFVFCCIRMQSDLLWYNTFFRSTQFLLVLVVVVVIVVHVADAHIHETQANYRYNNNV